MTKRLRPAVPGRRQVMHDARPGKLTKRQYWNPIRITTRIDCIPRLYLHDIRPLKMEISPPLDGKAVDNTMKKLHVQPIPIICRNRFGVLQCGLAHRHMAIAMKVETEYQDVRRDMCTPILTWSMESWIVAWRQRSNPSSSNPLETL